MSVVEYKSFSQFKEFIENKHKNIDDILGSSRSFRMSVCWNNYHIYYDEEFVSLFTDDLSLMLRLENIIN